MNVSMRNTPTSHTGLNVRAEMARKGFSQSAMSKELGISQSAMSKRLNGSVPFDINELTHIAAKLTIPLTALIDGVEKALEETA